MSAPNANWNHLWSWLIISELIRQGIDYFCISPGSRSTPLTTAAAQHSRAKTIIIYDERAAAFHALGYARVCGRPAALICTSGTAAANYFPAVIEAAQENIPLIILSADRPPELRDSGANQTIDQVKLYGSYVRWFFDLPAPDKNILPEFVLSTVDKLATHALNGPAHLNCMFRDPLEPVPTHIPDAYKQSVQKWEEKDQPLTRYEVGYAAIEPETLKEIAVRFNKAKNGLVVLGRLTAGQDRRAIVEFTNRLGWPVFADITSGFRLAGNMTTIIPYFDLLLTVEEPRFDMVLHLGGRYVSKRLLQLFAKHKPDVYYHVFESQQTIDPAFTVTNRLRVTGDYFCRQMLPILSQTKTAAQTKILKNKSHVISGILKETLDNNTKLTQPALSRELSRLLPDDSGLFLASSLPVREMNWFARAGKGWIATASNRGASGIDGTVASAAGFATGLKRMVTLLIGDLALLHDLNSLLVLQRNEQPVIVVVENNHGGGIFHFLPIAAYEKVFEPYFATPHQLSFEQAAGMFGLAYFAPKTMIEFREAYRQAVDSKRSVLIEVQNERTENSALYKAILQRLKEAL